MADYGGPRPVNPFSMAWRGRLAQFFFLVTLFSFPIFSVPCHKGTCFSAIEVVVSYLHHQDLVSKGVLKALVYPAAFLSQTESIVADNEDFALPDWKRLLDRFEIDGATAQSGGSTDLVLLGGCLLSVLGALLSAFGPSYVSLISVAVLLWYIFFEGASRQDVYALPMFTLAVLCALGCLPVDGLFPKSRVPMEVVKNASFHSSSRGNRLGKRVD